MIYGYGKVHPLDEAGKIGQRHAGLAGNAVGTEWTLDYERGDQG